MPLAEPLSVISTPSTGTIGGGVGAAGGVAVGAGDEQLKTVPDKLTVAGVGVGDGVGVGEGDGVGAGEGVGVGIGIGVGVAVGVEVGVGGVMKTFRTDSVILSEPL